MDYSYFAPTSQPYPFFDIASKAGPAFTPHEEVTEVPNDLDPYSDPNGFQFYENGTTFDTAPITLAPHTPPAPFSHDTRPSLSNALPFESTGSVGSEMNPDADFDQARGGSSEEDKDNLTPAQSRRKAQNRAAQRAFRERKERHVKDLELKLKSMEAHSTGVLSENERLKRELDRIATQNEILRATSTPMNFSKQNQQTPPTQSSSAAAEPFPVAAGPMIYSPRSFNAVFAEHNSSNVDEPISHRVAVSPTTGERLLATGAAWDMIQTHEYTRRGLVDLAEVADRLKDRVLCDGSGPTLAESEVLKALEASVGAAGDELI